MAKKRLTDYERKRDFASTPEPSGDGGGDGAGGQRFVVQEHSATRLHWDLRLERDGALASWAIPRGFPDQPKDNRLAVRTEDHPIEYLEFEGTIPKGEYGAGEMSIWDQGTYDAVEWTDRKVTVDLHGERLQGRYALFRTKDRNWMIHRMDPPARPDVEPMPERLVPMLARAGDLPPRQEDWGFEVKWDGVRAIAYSEPGRLRLESRNLREITNSYPELKRLNRALHHHEAVLDGEIVAFGEDGRPSFERLQSRMHIASEAQARRRSEGAPVTYVIFDLLWLDGHSLMDLPYVERRERLAELELDGEHWKVPAHHVGAGTALLEATRSQGLEGIVAKRLDCPYQPGRRSPGWVKVKNVARQELVIGGWLPGEGRRRERIGALLVGYHDDEGALRYAGRVGTGFNDKELDRLGRLLAERERADSPFEGEPRPPKGAQFVEPDLVCEVEFTAWTRDGMLRHPSYKGLRDDKPAAEVVREPAPVLATAGEEVDAVPDPGSGDEPTLAELVASGREVKGGVEIELEGRTLKLSNLDKVLYPETGFTKGDAIDYALRIAPVLLPHLRDRPLTLKRYPDGVEGKSFFEKNCPKHRPEWVETVPVTSSRAKTGTVDYCLCQDLPTLVWLANLAAVELHPSLSHVPELERPTMLVFDLDPGPPATVVECCRVAQLLRGMFGQFGIESWPKTSGSKGLQVYAPLNGDVTYDQTKPFAKAVAETLERGAGELVVSRQAKELRPGKVLVDWSQNDEAKTTISVYSLRARARPTVSTPVTWDEVDACAEAGDADLLVFQAGDVLERVGREGDLFAPVLTEVQALPEL